MADHSDQLTDIADLGTTAEGLTQVVALRAVTHLLGPVKGRIILDLACGSGILSRWLALHGAHVTGIDISAEAIELARSREAQDPHGISYLVADAEDLYMIDDSAFEDVVCNLSLGRVENLSAVVAEVARVIRLGGRFIFSVQHPCFEPILDASQGARVACDYFAEGPRAAPRGTIRHRTLATYINAVAARGFTVRRVMEPAADQRDISANPELSIWRRVPAALVVEAVFPHI